MSVQFRSLWIVPALLALAALPARADGCDPVVEANVKAMHTPHKLTTIDHSAGETKYVEIRTADNSFTRFSGTMLGSSFDDGWKSSPLNLVWEEDRYRKGFVQLKKTCRLDGSASIGGEQADIFLTLVEATNEPVYRTWISRSSGLPLRMERTPSDADKSDVTVYEYGNIQPPKD